MVEEQQYIEMLFGQLSKNIDILIHCEIIFKSLNLPKRKS